MGAAASEKQRTYVLALMRKIHNHWGTGKTDDEIIEKIEERWNVYFPELTAEEAHRIIDSIKGFRDPTYQSRKRYRPNRKSPEPTCALCSDPDHRMQTCPQNPVYKATLE